MLAADLQSLSTQRSRWCLFSGLLLAALKAKIHEGMSKTILAEDVTLGVNDEFLTGPLNSLAERLYLSWTSWSHCTASCGGGQRMRTRHCEPHIPLIVQSKCEGEVVQEQFCNIHVCPGEELGRPIFHFRALLRVQNLHQDSPWNSDMGLAAQHCSNTWKTVLKKQN